MARDKITVDLILATKQADREVARINKNIEKLGKTMGRSFGGAAGGTDKVRALGSGLSKATVKADEFSKSMEASNARVIAFGASAGLIMGVDRALKAMVSSAMKVEKAMMDVNVVMGVSNRQLEQFGKGMFKVAKDTAQSFDTVAEAATELARQGLGMEKTLARTKDALILTRLTGMGAADAVKSLTAAVNSFNKEGVTSTQIVNRMAKVDAAYAVSSEDLAKAISRVGASAISAGVGLNELMAITTAVQQKTARGGAVIGNAFKTIFTRIQRASVQKKLKDFGIASRDMQGNMLGGIKVLQNMADQFDNLTKSQQASLAENVAGVFQVNILKSALSDLSSQTSHYTGALKAANSATNEAYKRNEQLNQTLDALANRTLANLTQAGASLGGATLEPAIRKILDSVNSVIDSFSEGGQFESFGKTIGKGLLTGIGNFISGPGLMLATAAFAKISISLAKFAGTAFKDIMGLNAATKQRVALEEAVIAHIASQPTLLAQVRTGTLNVLTVEQDILATVRLANAERARIVAYSGPITGALMGRGVRTGSRGATMGPPGGAHGFVPNFASPGGERAAAAAGGYRAGSIKTMQQPGAGTMMYNSAETVKRFPGMSQSAIMPPQGSPAGAGYKAAFGGAHGFDPYAGRGFVPNFGRPAGPASPFAQKASWGAKTKNQAGKSRAAQEKAAGFTYDIDADDIGVLLGFGVGQQGAVTQKPFAASAKGLLGLKKWPDLYKQLSEEGARIRLNNVKIRSFKSGRTAKNAELEFADEIKRNIKGGLSSLASNMMGQLGIEGAPGNVGTINEAFQGEVFEESMRMAMKAAQALPGAAFDFEANSPPSPVMAKIFGRPISRIDAKRRIESAAGAQHGIPKKYFNDTGMAPIGVNQIISRRAALFNEFDMGGGKRPFGKKGEWAGPFQKMTKGPGKAAGFVPNFSPLSSALGRELQAGVPASAIRVGSSPSLRSSGNPGGVGVYNTIHEPGGLQQGVSRSRSQGINPRSHGVPNFQILDQFGFPTGSSTPAGGGVPSGGRPVGVPLDLSKITIKGGDEWDSGTKKFLKGSTSLEAAAMKQQRAANAMMMASIAISMVGPSIGSALGGGTPSGEAAGSGIANMLSMGMMGAATGAMMGGGALSVPGALIGGAVGVGMGAMSMDWSGAFGEAGEKADAQQILDQAKAVSEGLATIKKALEEMANLDYMTVGDRMLKFAKLQDKFLNAERILMEGGEATAGVTKKFRTNKAIQAYKAGDFSKMSAKDFKEIDRTLEETIGEAQAITTSGSQVVFEEKMGTARKYATQLKNLKARKAELDLPVSQGGKKLPWGAEFVGKTRGERITDYEEKIGDLNVKIGEGVRDSFSGNLQKRMATGKVRGRYGEVSGESIIKNFQANVEKGDIRAALSGGILPLMRESGAEKMADAMEEMVGPEGRKKGSPGFGGPKRYTDDDLRRMAQGEGMSTSGRSTLEGNMFSRSAGAAAFNLMTQGEKTGQLGMFQDMYAPQKDQLTDKEKADLQDKQRKGIRKFQTPIDKARKAGRTAGFEMISGKADRRREMAVTSVDRQNRKRLDAVTMFGDSLIDAGKAIEYEKIEEGKRLKDEEIEETRREKRTQLLAKSQEKYLTSIRDADVGIDEKKIAEDSFTDFRKKLEKKDGVSLLKEERDDLQVKGKLRSTVEEKQLTALNEIINAEVTTRELSTHSLAENAEELVKNVKIVDDNTEAQKKLLKATKQFYSGKHLNNLEREKSILQGRIEFQEKEVKEGRIHASVLQKSTSRMRTLNNELGVTANAFDDFYRKPMEEQRDQLKEQIKWEKGEVAARRMSIAALEETRVELEKLSQKIDGTGDAFGSLMAQARRVMGKGLDPGERRASEEAAAQEFRDLMRGRQGGDSLGTQRVLGTGGPKDAFKQGLITADEYRNLRKTARVGRGGDPGEAFRDQFMYGGRDYMLEMESGMTSIAQNMKSSFASAFQSIASGADSVQGALANMAQSILNSISSISANMFTNMLFSRMQGGNSQGGLIPGYQRGGVVTGGSGNKDDVLTKMQGGEFVIKKSSAQKIGYETLNSINSYAGGGGVPKDTSNASMGKMGAIAAGAGALSGIIGAATQSKPPEPLPMQDYGMGRGKYGYFGGADPDAGQVDSVRGGRGRAEVSLGKSFVHYRRDPDTGELVSERARPTEGRFEVSSRLSLLGRLGDDPQTSRMFGKEQSMANYQKYLADETKSRADQIQAVEDQKKARRIQAGVNAVMLIGGAYAMDKMQAASALAKQTGGIGSTKQQNWGYMKGQDLSGLETTSSISNLGGSLSGAGHYPRSLVAGAASDYGRGYGSGIGGGPGDALGGYKHYENGGRTSGTPAMVMGGEYVMSPETVRTYGVDFMSELNRGNVPGPEQYPRMNQLADGGPVGFANGGPVRMNADGARGGAQGGLTTTNNVRINVNIDKRGTPEISAGSTSEDPTAKGQQAEDNDEVLNNKEFAGVLEGVVLEQILKQQRPGGLLSPHTP